MSNILSALKSNKIVWMALAVAISALGTAVHTIREFGYSGLFALGTGFIPVVAIQVMLFFVWWLVPRVRSAAALALVATAVLQLLG